MKFGIRLPNSGPLANRANIVRVADEAERLGFHSVWVHDHILWGSEQHRTHLSAGSSEALDEAQKPNFYESITTMSYLAGRTTSVRLGISVLVLPLRNPVVVAKELANLDVLSQGRLILGIAPGAQKITKPEFDAVGAPYEERGRVTDEYVTAIRKLWTELLPSFSGRYVSFNAAQLFPKPSKQGIPILVGGGERGISPRALRRVVELGDGWIPAYLTPEEITAGVAKIKEATISSKNYIVAHEMFAVLDSNSENAVRLASKSLATNFSSVEEGLKRSLVGDPEEFAAKLLLYKKAGVDVTELKFVYSSVEDLIRMMREFRDSVLQALS